MNKFKIGDRVYYVSEFDGRTLTGTVIKSQKDYGPGTLWCHWDDDKRDAFVNMNETDVYLFRKKIKRNLPDWF